MTCSPLKSSLLVFGLLSFCCQAAESQNPVHVFERVELTFTAANTYFNPYTEVEMWVDLRGPGFNRRCYGFWDGGQTFRVRVTATKPGKWTWVSGSNQVDIGLRSKTGSFTAREWTEAEKKENPNRRGFVTAMPNGHALQYADGTPFFAVGDFFYPACSARFPWRDSDENHPVDTPEGGYKDLVKLRKQQGFNMLFFFAAFPSWTKDDYPRFFSDKNGVPVRDGWQNGNEKGVQDMVNEEGELPFFYPGRAVGYPNAAPDMTRLNPKFFRLLDKKMEYAYGHGFVVFVETLRRDITKYLAAYFGHTNPNMWENATFHFIRHIFARYHADPVVLGIIHFDHFNESSLTPEGLRVPLDGYFRHYGDPPFGHLVTTNVAGSTYRAWGHTDKSPWITMHQTGNSPRSHLSSDYMLEMYRLKDPIPAYNQEPWYIHSDEPEERRKNRATMYASLLNGGLVGVAYQAQGLTRGVREPNKQFPMMWEAATWQSANEAVMARDFLLKDCPNYWDLIPNPEYLNPQKSGPKEDPKRVHWSYNTQMAQEGWAFCMNLADKSVFKLYFERRVPAVTLSALRPNTAYRAAWFDPRTAKWQPLEGSLRANAEGQMVLPPRPSAEDDWGLQLIAEKT